MQLASLEQYVDISLLQQMKHLLFILSSEDKQFTERQRNSLFGQCVPVNPMEEQYGLNYPGEVLERYEERCGGGERQMRAIMLALAEGKNLLEGSMFVGRQLEQFLRKVRLCAEGDFYLSCALFLFSDKEGEKEKLRSRICRYSFQETAEAIFAIYTLRDEPDAWEFAREQAVRFFGKDRTIKAYGNERLYEWFLEQFYYDIRKYRKQDANLLKSLLELPCKYVKEGSTPWNRFLEMGYTEQEILYLNLSLPENAKMPDVLELNSITMERMALAGVQMLFNSEHLEVMHLMALCKALIIRYMKYEICLEGKKGILESLSRKVFIKNHDIYKYLYQGREEMHIPEEWFYVNFGDENWCDIATWMNPDEFECIFARSLYFHLNSDIELWLLNFQKSTGRSYMDFVWIKDTDEVKQTFKRLITEKKCDVVELFQQYVEDERTLSEDEMSEKWKIMKANIMDTMKKLDHHEIFRFWEAFDKEYGICELGNFMGKDKIILDDVIIETSGYYRGHCIQRLDFKEGILSLDEQRKLFVWVEQALYRERPSQYEDFFYAFLTDDLAKRLFPEQSKELFFAIRDTMDDGPQKQRLCRQYYTDEEWEIYRNEEKQRDEEKKRKDKQESLRRCREEMEQEISTAKDCYEVYDMLSKRFSKLRWSDDKFFVCLNLFRDNMKICAKIGKKAAGTIAECIVDEFRFNRLAWCEVQEIISKMEVVHDGNSED